MRTVDLTIEGMGCGNCVKKIQNRLGALQGVQVEFVQKGRARVKYDEARVSHRDLERAVNEAGYSVMTCSQVPEEGN